MAAWQNLRDNCLGPGGANVVSNTWPATQRLVSHLNDRDVATTVSTTRDRDLQHSLQNGLTSCCFAWGQTESRKFSID